MEQLIKQLNDPANQGSSERIQAIQRQIQQLQREKSAWQTGLEFLQHDDAVIRFYGALTLTIKINADWEHDSLKNDVSMQEHLREALITSYVRLSLLEDSSFVLQKLCSTLCAFYQRTSTTWHYPVRHVFACLVQGQYVAESQVAAMRDLLLMALRDTTRALGGVLLFVLTLAEDVADRLSSDSLVARSMSRSCDDVFTLLDGSMSSLSVTHDTRKDGESTSTRQTNTASNLTLFRVAIAAVPLWLPLLKPQAGLVSKEESAHSSRSALSCISAIVRSLTDDDLTEAVLQALTSIQQSSPRLLMKAESSFPQAVIRSDAIQRRASMLLEGDFSQETVLLVDFLESVMSQVDVTTPKYLETGSYSDVLQLLLSLMQCPGTAAVEDTVCQVVLEIISQIIEGYTDWSERSEADDFLKEYARQVCQACLTKITLPDEELSRKTETWDKDDRTKHHSFVRDVQDFFQSAYSILGLSLIEAVVRSIAQPVEVSTWGEFDAGLVCLLAFSDTIASEPEVYNQYISAVLASERFQLILALAEVPDRPRSTCIKFLAGCTTYLQHHPDLMQILNFLFSSLHLPTAASGASRAIYTLCDTQRRSLTPALSDFLASLSTINDLRGIERQRIFGGVAAISQALTAELDQIQPLEIMITLVLRDCERLVEHAEDHEIVVGESADVLETLAAMGRGLRLPTDGPIEAETADHDNESFWTNGPGSVIQERVLKIYRTVMNYVDLEQDLVLIEAACQFLRSGYPEDHPSPFKFTSVKNVELVAEMIRVQCGNINVVGECVSALLASADRAEFRPYLSHLLEPVLGGLRQLLTSPDPDVALSSSDFPTAALNIATRMLPKWSETILESDRGAELINIFVDTALAVIRHPDTLPRRSAALFYSTLIDITKPNKGLSEVAQRNLQMILQYKSQLVVASLLHLVAGECARSELDVLTDPIRRFAQYQPMLFKRHAKESVSDASGVLSAKALSATQPGDRLRFVAQVDMLKGARKTNEVVRDFWHACKGSSFDYIS